MTQQQQATASSLKERQGCYTTEHMECTNQWSMTKQQQKATTSSLEE
jgi:hypothetical protein